METDLTVDDVYCYNVIHKDNKMKVCRLIGGVNMSLIGGFLTYLILMLIIVCVAGAAFFLGVTLRKKKDAEKIAKDKTNES